ncbi:MAG: class I SAM-dependent methyltransferase [Gammaproteobacteria bacterium]|nr:class I SAM-dependent methyltransferase [Gammaproteobacteria bacterium]
MNAPSPPADRITGADYVDALAARASDRRAREDFRAQVLALVPAGGSVFDFGCGPGLDARFYAEQGREVGAYDVDPHMCAYLQAHCAPFLASGRIRLIEGPYPEFLERCAGSEQRFDLISANFAPLSMIDDLRALFAAFQWLLRPGGVVLASVLSPYCLADLRYGWWWRNAPRLALQGAYGVPGAQGRIWRRRLGNFARESSPAFTLEAVTPGPSLWSAATSRRPRPLPATGAWLALTSCRYMFLRWRRMADSLRR